jgi:type VI secretion system protein ImpH
MSESTPPNVAFLRNLEAEPWRFDFFDVLRHLERVHNDRPRISDSASRRDEFVLIGHEPYLEFPASNLARVEQGDNKPLKIFVKFLGLLGPQGPLPLALTEEVFHYTLANDDAFPRFADIFNHRFIQLFFRAWADARPIAQHDRPDADRFIAYIGSHIGLGSKPYLGLDTVPDPAKVGLAGLLSAQARCPSRLARAIGGLFNVEAEVEEFVGTRLVLEDAELTILGARYSVLGGDALLGRSLFSVQDKIRVRIFTRSLGEYIRFLPTGDLCEPLADLVFFYNGEQLDWDTELAIPARSVQPIKLGQFGQLGWTSWMSPNWAAAEPMRCDARFHPADRMRDKRRARAQATVIGDSNGGYQP